MAQLTENQSRWLTALRSGDYKQGRITLHHADTGYCCLGVAAAIFKKPGTSVEMDEDRTIVHDGKTAVAPDYVIEALNLRGGWGEARDNRGSLAAMNDDGVTFVEIASRFERNLDLYTKDPE